MTAAIIVAAGRGTRMGPNVDKLFLEVAGRPLVAHTWSRFDRCEAIHEIILVVRDGMQDAFQQMLHQFAFAKPCRFIVGGNERQDSVWNGLDALAPEAEVALIQDGARPC